MKESEKLNILVQYASGKSCVQIAKSIGVCHHTVARRLRELGVRIEPGTSRSGKSRRAKFVADWEAMALEYRNGATLKELATKYRIPVTRVRVEVAARVDRLRTQAEWTELSLTKPIPDLAVLAARHTAGEPIEPLARSVGVKGETLARRLRRAGYATRGDDRSLELEMALPSAGVVSDYAAGMTVSELARKNGVSRTAIATRLRHAKVPLRGQEATSQLGGEARASTRQVKRQNITPDERRVAKHFDSIGLVYEQQRAAGSFNIDFAFPDDKVGIEIDGGPGFFYPKSVATWERADFLIRNGWFILFVVTRYKPIDFAVVTDRIQAFRKVAASGVDPGYGVILRDGSTSKCKKHNLFGLSRVAGF